MPFEIERVDFTRQAVDAWARGDGRNTDWPVVYILDNVPAGRKKSVTALHDVYVGSRVMRQPECASISVQPRSSTSATSE